jgi:mannose-6-phosphate isomerase-like protein (cupin superfamily)
VSHAFSSLDELGDGPGFRKIRQPLGVTAFGVNALVLPAGHEGFLHYHDAQDELYFVHRGRVKIDADGASRELGEGGLFHAEAACRRSISNPFDEEAVVFVVGGKDGYVERDGHLVEAADLERRKSF